MLPCLPGAEGQQGSGDLALLLEQFILVSLKNNTKTFDVVFFHLQDSTQNGVSESYWRSFVMLVMYLHELQSPPTPANLSTIVNRDSFSLFVCHRVSGSTG